MSPGHSSVHIIGAPVSDLSLYQTLFLLSTLCSAPKEISWLLPLYTAHQKPVGECQGDCPDCFFIFLKWGFEPLFSHPFLILNNPFGVFFFFPLLLPQSWASVTLMYPCKSAPLALQSLALLSEVLHCSTVECGRGGEAQNFLKWLRLHRLQYPGYDQVSTVSCFFVCTCQQHSPVFSNQSNPLSRVTWFCCLRNPERKQVWPISKTDMAVRASYSWSFVL